MGISRRELFQFAGTSLVLASAPAKAVRQLTAPLQLISVPQPDPAAPESEWIVGPSRDRATDRYWLSSCCVTTGQTGQTPIPFRGHGVLVHPLKPDSVVVLPKKFPVGGEINYKKNVMRRRLVVPKDFWFYGHGTFSPDGSKLYTTEVDKVSGRGFIRVRDSRTYIPMGEILSYGVEPHDLRIIHDGSVLVTANHGGYESYNSIWNRDVRTCVSFIDLKSGKLIKKLHAEGSGFSLSHLMVMPDGSLLVSSYRPRKSPLPGFASVYVATDDGLEKLPVPDDIHWRLTDQCFSMALHKDSGTLGVTCVDSNLVLFWNYRERKFLRAFESQDPEGIVVTKDQRHFLITTESGEPIWLETATLQRAYSPPQKLQISNSSHMISV